MFAKTLSKLTTALFAAAMIGLAATAVAWAQNAPCGERSEIVSWLESAHQERQAGFGLIGSVAVVELYTSPAGSWTLIATDRSKRTCFVAFGNSWIDVPPAPTESISRL